MAENPENKNLDTEELGVETPKKRPGRLVRVLLVLLPVILLPASAGAYLVYNQYSNIARIAVAVGLDFGIEEPEEREKPIRYGEFYTFDNLLVNPANSAGKNILVADLVMEAKKGGVLNELEEKSVVLRDALLEILAERTVNELADISLRQEIKDSLLATTNQILTKGRVERLYFTEYILQRGH